MEANISGVMLAALTTEDGTNRSTGEVIRAEGQIFMLVTERERPAVKKIKCSLGLAAKLAAEGIEIGKPVKESNFLVDISEYSINGRSGVSYKIVELDNRNGLGQSRQPVPAAPANGQAVAPPR